jgi:glycosyltransferase involved in cell wall biosynthesis
MGAQLISIVLPVYNQADHLHQVISEYERALQNVSVPHELILVPNGCRDDSEKVADALATEFPSVRVIASPEGGWGKAVRLGLKNAKGDVVCYTNLARTQAQDLLLLVLYAIANEGVVIKANRKIRENWRRRLGSLLYNLECRMLFDLEYWDVNGTPKVFDANVHAKVLGLTREDDLIDLEFNVICHESGYRMLEVPLVSTKRHGGRSTTNLRSAFRMYWGAWKMSKARRSKP